VTAGLADAVATFDDTLAEMADFLTPRTVQRLAAARAEVVVLPTSCSEKEIPMTQPEPQTEIPDAPAAVQQMTMGYADAVEVAELCQLAGVPERTASYLAAQTPVANVRRTLLALRADGSEITSHLTPEAMAAKPEALKDNPLIAQARARAGKD
jgi:hypothetical protein